MSAAILKTRRRHACHYSIVFRAAADAHQRSREHRKLVVAALAQSLLELPRGEFLAGLGGEPHRADDQPDDQVRDGSA